LKQRIPGGKAPHPGVAGVGGREVGVACESRREIAELGEPGDAPWVVERNTPEIQRFGGWVRGGDAVRVLDNELVA